MNQFRAAVASLLAGPHTLPPLVPRVEPQGSARATLRRGSRESELIRKLQRILGLDDDGIFGNITEAAVRAKQRQLNLVPDGIVGPKTWAALDAATVPHT